MKLVVAIVNYNDSNKVLSKLTEHNVSVTKLSTTGGFLRNGNRTLLIGTEDERVPEILEIIKTHCHSRKQYMPSAEVTPNVNFPIEVVVGGATVFVLDVEQFEKF